MEIYEKIFARLEELKLSQREFSRRTGIATSTINDWKIKKTNPHPDKLVTICKALEMSIVDLMCNEEDKKDEVLTGVNTFYYETEDKKLIEILQKVSKDDKQRLLKYMEKFLEK